MGDFLGFTFGGVRSSDLGITRISGGDRYDEQLHSEIKDRTAEVPGLNGEYYFGSDFGSRQFDIDIAFDHLTEQQFRKLRTIFGTKDIKELIFDERPYKKYMAKLESPVELSYICFDEPIKVKFSEEYNIGTIDTESEAISDGVLTELPDGVRMVDDGQGNRVREKVDPWIYKEGIERIYKGEGKMSFICHFPFAKSVYKQLPVEDEESEWAISSGILNAEERESIDIYNEGSITVYNAGDIETGFRMYIPAAIVSEAVSLTYINSLNQTVNSLHLRPMTIKDDDVGILIDTNNDLIIGVFEAPILDPISGQWNYTTSGNLYNQYIESGQFFKIEPMILNNYATIQIEGGGEGIQIFYDYLYF